MGNRASDTFRGPSRAARALLALPLFALLVGACLGSVAVLPAQAAPTPAQKLAAARAEAKRTQAVLDDMDAQLEGIVEQYNKIQEDLDQTDREIMHNQVRLDEATARLEHAQAVLNRRVREIYRSPELGMIDVVLGTSDFADFLARLDFLTRIGNQDATVKLEVERAKTEIERVRRLLAEKRAQQVQLRRQLESRRDDIQAHISAKERYLSRLNKKIQRLIQEEAERQRRLALARARAAWGGTQPSWYPKPDTIYPREKVVDIALAQLGKPYQWGATGPDSFDCSGLMLYCYAYVGILLPRVSQDQARFGTQLSRDELRPGDLVYFGYDADPNRVHHIGMYIGSGRYVHAPKRNDVVKISLLSERNDYAGATRP